MYKSKWLGAVELIFSILLIICGVFTLTRPAAAIGGAAIVYGILAIATGVMDIVIYAKLERHTGFGPATVLVRRLLPHTPRRGRHLRPALHLVLALKPFKRRPLYKAGAFFRTDSTL